MRSKVKTRYASIFTQSEAVHDIHCAQPGVCYSTEELVKRYQLGKPPEGLTVYDQYSGRIPIRPFRDLTDYDRLNKQVDSLAESVKSLQEEEEQRLAAEVANQVNPADPVTP